MEIHLLSNSWLGKAFCNIIAQKNITVKSKYIIKDKDEVTVLNYIF